MTWIGKSVFNLLRMIYRRAAVSAPICAPIVLLGFAEGLGIARTIPEIDSMIVVWEIEAGRLVDLMIAVRLCVAVYEIPIHNGFLSSGNELKGAVGLLKSQI